MRKKIYQKALENEGVPRELAAKCAEILVQDSIQSRTKDEQEIIDQAWKIGIKKK